MELTPIVPYLFLVPGARKGRFPFSHCILADSTPPTLIDAGCGLGILEQLKDVTQLEQVIASHAHPDHTAGCHLLEGLPLHVPEQTALTFGQKELLADRFAEPGPLAEIWKAYVTGAMGFEDTAYTHTYGDGHVFELGHLRFTAIHAPGHTVDHMCLFEPAHGVLLSFDIDLTWFGPWYGHRESDILQFKESILKVMDLEPRVIVSSHLGIVRDNIQERLQRFLDVFDARQGAIMEMIRSRPRTLEELALFSPIYNGRAYAPELLRYWETQMIRKHLDLLAAQGRIQKEPNGRYRASSR